jgi:hypothetical protein
MRIVIHTDADANGRWSARVFGVTVHGASREEAECAAQVIALRHLAEALETATIKAPLGVISFERNGDGVAA